MSHSLRSGAVLLTDGCGRGRLPRRRFARVDGADRRGNFYGTVTLADTGHVLDTAFKPLAGVRVDVIDGPQAGAAMVTGADGVFPLSGAVAWHVERDRRARFQAPRSNTGTVNPRTTD